jgi:uncharacterized protein Yka (UPF0111/DUF47 family)
MAENNLKNTILVDGVEYNIYAKYSETAGTADSATVAEKADSATTAGYADTAGTAVAADKVSNGLTVKESGSQIFVFDGSTGGQVIDYVSAANGGTFSNAVFVDNKYPDIKNIHNTAIINFGQTTQLVSALKNAPLHSWDANGLSVFKGSHNALYGLNTVVGTTEDFETFKRLLGVPKLSYETSSSELYYGISLNNYGTGKCSVGSYDKSRTYTEVFLPSIGYPSFNSSTKTLALTDKRDLTCIGEKAFQYNTTITKVVIPESVTEIKASAFDGCTALKTIRLPSKLDYLSGFTFRNCSSLESIIIGANIITGKIESSAFNGCTSLNKIYYAGTEEAWNSLIEGIKVKYPSNNGTTVLDTITKNNGVVFNYQYTPEFTELPCIYVCSDNTVDSLNKLFLKMPNEAFFAELSRSANYLESTSAASKQYYTYEGLAEIIARINVRLDALGGTALKITNTALTTIPSIEDVNALVPNVEIKEELDPNSIPTVQSLSGKIDKLRGDLDDLAREVEIELNREDNDINILTRLLAVEEAIKTLSGTADKLTLKDTYGEVTLDAEELRKIKALIGAIDWP